MFSRCRCKSCTRKCRLKYETLLCNLSSYRSLSIFSNDSNKGQDASKDKPSEREKLLRPLGIEKLSDTVRGLTPKRVLELLRYPIEPLAALSLFNWALQQKGFVANAVTYHALIKKLGDAGQFKALHSILQRMKNEGFICPEYILIDIMKCYGKARLPGQAARVLNLMMDGFKCRPSIKSFNVVLDILVSQKCYKMAQSVYYEMLRFRVSPTVFTFGIIINAFCNTNQVDVGCRLLREMPRHGCVPNAIIYRTLIYSLEKSRVQEALQLLDEMILMGCNPDVDIYSVLVNGLCKSGRIDEATRALFSCMFTSFAEITRNNMWFGCGRLVVILHHFQILKI